MMFRQQTGIFLGRAGAYAEVLSKYRVRRRNIEREKLSQMVLHVAEFSVKNLDFSKIFVHLPKLQKPSESAFPSIRKTLGLRDLRLYDL